MILEGSDYSVYRYSKSYDKKVCDSEQGLNLSLLNYGNSAVAGLNYSPAQLLMGRVLRSKLPLPSDRLKQRLVPNDKLKSLCSLLFLTARPKEKLANSQSYYQTSQLLCSVLGNK